MKTATATLVIDRSEVKKAGHIKLYTFTPARPIRLWQIVHQTPGKPLNMDAKSMSQYTRACTVMLKAAHTRMVYIDAPWDALLAPFAYRQGKSLMYGYGLIQKTPPRRSLLYKGFLDMRSVVDAMVKEGLNSQPIEHLICPLADAVESEIVKV